MKLLQRDSFLCVRVCTGQDISSHCITQVFFPASPSCDRVDFLAVILMRDLSNEEHAVCSRSAAGQLTPVSVRIYSNPAIVRHVSAFCVDLHREEDMYGELHRSLFV